MPSKSGINKIAADILEKNHHDEWAGAKLFDTMEEIADAGDLTWTKTVEQAQVWMTSILGSAKFEVTASSSSSSSKLANKMLQALSGAVGDEWDGAKCCDAVVDALREGDFTCSSQGLKTLQTRIEERDRVAKNRIKI